eukprot:13236941-Alexandrium_andersonii.AAC.1
MTDKGMGARGGVMTQEPELAHHKSGRIQRDGRFAPAALRGRAQSPVLSGRFAPAALRGRTQSSERTWQLAPCAEQAHERHESRSSPRARANVLAARVRLRLGLRGRLHGSPSVDAAACCRAQCVH